MSYITRGLKSKTNFAAVNDILALDVSQLNVVRIEFSGTYAFTGTFEVSNDSTNGTDGTWFPLQAVQANANVISLSHSTANATQAYEANVANATWAHIKLTAFTSAGTHKVLIAGTDAATEPNPTVQIAGTATVDTELPAAAALADTTTNPTAPLVGSANELFNNATWDRARNNYILNLDTSAARTTTATGTTGTNHNASGARFVVNVTAVSGTTPTLAVRLQYSYDGTSFIDYDTTNSQTASITAAGQYAFDVYHGLVTAANSAKNGVLPRTFRLAWTIGGTTPSFTFATYVHFSL